MSLCQIRYHRQVVVEVVVDDVEHNAEGDLSSCQVMVVLLDVHSLLPLFDDPFRA